MLAYLFSCLRSILFGIIISVSSSVNHSLWESVNHREEWIIVTRCMNDQQVVKHSERMCQLTIHS